MCHCFESFHHVSPKFQRWVFKVFQLFAIKNNNATRILSMFLWLCLSDKIHWKFKTAYIHIILHYSNCCHIYNMAIKRLVSVKLTSELVSLFHGYITYFWLSLINLRDQGFDRWGNWITKYMSVWTGGWETPKDNFLKLETKYLNTRVKHSTCVSNIPKKALVASQTLPYKGSLRVDIILSYSPVYFQYLAYSLRYSRYLINSSGFNEQTTKQVFQDHCKPYSTSYPRAHLVIETVK